MFFINHFVLFVLILKTWHILNLLTPPIRLFLVLYFIFDVKHVRSMFKIILLEIYHIAFSFYIVSFINAKALMFKCQLWMKYVWCAVWSCSVECAVFRGVDMDQLINVRYFVSNLGKR